MPLKSLRARFLALLCVALFFVFMLWAQVSYLSNENKIQRLKNETLMFIQAILPSYTTGHFSATMEFFQKLGYTIIPQIPEDAKILYTKKDSTLYFSIFTTPTQTGFKIDLKNITLIGIRDMDYDFWDQNKFLILFLPVISILIIFQAILFSLLNPLTRITKIVSEMAKGNYNIELKTSREDELGELIRGFSKSQQTIIRMIKSKQLILRSLGHEIKTPLAKMKLALKSPHEADQKKLENYIQDLEKISERVLEFERVNSGNITLNPQHFFTETLLLEALIPFEDEASNIEVQITKNHNIYSDLSLLCIATRNLIDNALKYSSNKKLIIKTQENTLDFINKADPLKHDISYYLEPFYREDTHSNLKGYGLGLSIIQEILKILDFSLHYQYKDGMHTFSIQLKKSSDKLKLS